MRKLTLLAAVCCVAISTTAFAQSAKAEAWTGCYVGGDVGMAWNSTTVTDEVDTSVVLAQPSATNITGGARLGCDYQISGPLVIGLSGGFDWTGLKSSVTSGALDPLYLTGKVSRVATIDARLGYLFTPNTLGYAKVGLALTRSNARLTDGGTLVDSVSFSQSGISAGAGVEQRIQGNFSVFAEYNYYGANNKTVAFPNATAIGIVHQNNQAVSVGVNYRFWHN